MTSEPLIEQIHRLDIEERDIGVLYDDVPQDIVKRFFDAETAIKNKWHGARDNENERALILLELDALREAWNQWQSRRLKKIIVFAENTVLNQEQTDLSGALDFEKEVFSDLVEIIDNHRYMTGLQ